jgi:hypothetical protein
MSRPRLSPEARSFLRADRLNVASHSAISYLAMNTL